MPVHAAAHRDWGVHVLQVGRQARPRLVLSIGVAFDEREALARGLHLHGGDFRPVGSQGVPEPTAYMQLHAEQLEAGVLDRLLELFDTERLSLGGKDVARASIDVEVEFARAELARQGPI